MNVTVAHTAVLCAFLDKATTQRLTQEQEELLQIHQKLGHMPMELIQKNLCGHVYPIRLRKCEIPLCAACQFGKQTKRPLYKKSLNLIRPTPTRRRSFD